MKKWKCTVCGYVHEGEEPPSKCPICDAGSEDFELLNVQDEQSVQQCLFNMTYGLYVITSKKDNKISGMTSNSFVQMTSSPIQAVVGVNKENLSHDYINSSGVFIVNFLGNDNHFEVKRFGYNSGRNFDKFKKVEYKLGDKTQCPVLLNTIGYVECKINRDKCVDLGTHTLFVVDVISGEILNPKEPMTYAYYRQTK